MTPTQRSRRRPRRRENFITKAREINFSIGIVTSSARAMPLLTSKQANPTARYGIKCSWPREVNSSISNYLARVETWEDSGTAARIDRTESAGREKLPARDTARIIKASRVIRRRIAGRDSGDRYRKRKARHRKGERKRRVIAEVPRGGKNG